MQFYNNRQCEHTDLQIKNINTFGRYTQKSGEHSLFKII